MIVSPVTSDSESREHGDTSYAYMQKTKNAELEIMPTRPHARTGSEKDSHLIR